MEIQSVPTLMAHRQIREDEVASGLRTIQIRNTSDGHTSQDGSGLRARAPSLGDETLMLQAHVQNKVGIITESDICSTALVGGIAIEDVQLDYRRRINWTTVGRGYRYQSAPRSQ